MTATRSAAPPSSLTQLGSRRHANLSVAELYEHAIRASEGLIAHGGPLLVRTGQHTGRSPQDKYIVDTVDTHDGVWWGGFNQPISEERYDALRQRIVDHLASRELFVRDCYVGARPTLASLRPGVHGDGLGEHLLRQPVPDPARPRTCPGSLPTSPSSTRPASGPTRSVTGCAARRSSWSTWTARRSSSAARSTPARSRRAPSASSTTDCRRGRAAHALRRSTWARTGDVAIFFGLSGTGKTTLSADPERTLIGDDEHGWGPDGVFNFEGGCYAKTIRLSHVYEPDIYSTTRRFGTILENVVIDPATPHPRPRLRAADREHPGRIPAALHQQQLRQRASPATPRPSSS